MDVSSFQFLYHVMEVHHNRDGLAVHVYNSNIWALESSLLSQDAVRHESPLLHHEYVPGEQRCC